MKQVINTEKRPIKIWTDDLDDNALEQAKNAANLPFCFKHIALMPDTHLGYSLPIGGVLATTDVIVPSAVGYDISCSVSVCKTSLTEITKEQLLMILGGSKEYQGGTKTTIPVGISRHKKKQKDWLIEDELADNKDTIVYHEYDKSLKQLGTLGS